VVSVVVDASLAAKWVVREPDTPQAHALLEQWRNIETRLVAPIFLPFEVTNVLHRKVRSAQLSLETAVRLIGEFDLLGVELVLPAGIHSRSLQIAAQLGHGAAYDAHYLALGEMLEAECWTADGRLYRSASASFPNLRLLGAAPAA
jgi:predicted nucleic acid-binding protein